MSKAAAYKRSKAVTEHSDPYGVTKKIEVGLESAGNVVESVITAPFDIIIWLKNNWQLALIGGVAVLILIKD